MTKDQARGVEQWIIEINTSNKGYPARNSTLDNINNSTDPNRTTIRDNAYTVRRAAGLAVLNSYDSNWREKFNFSLSDDFNNAKVKGRLKLVDREKYKHLYKTN